MPLPPDLRMRDATDDDLPTLVALRDAAGWRRHEWALRAVLDAPSARCVVAVDADGVVVGVGSGIAYGAIGIVGNMIVIEPHRRRGVGSAILASVMTHLRDDRGCVRLELSATPAGRPLYERHGFTAIEPGARARLPDLEPPADGPEVTRTRDAASLAAYDAPRFGGDRSSLLTMMATDPDRPLFVARRGDAISGFAWLRPEEGRIGPFMADDPADAQGLIVAAATHGADEPLTINVPASNTVATGWLASIGVEIDPWDGRMAVGRQVPRRESTIYGNVAGALG